MQMSPSTQCSAAEYNDYAMCMTRWGGGRRVWHTAKHRFARPGWVTVVLGSIVRAPTPVDTSENHPGTNRQGDRKSRRQGGKETGRQRDRKTGR